MFTFEGDPQTAMELKEDALEYGVTTSRLRTSLGLSQMTKVYSMRRGASAFVVDLGLSLHVHLVVPPRVEEKPVEKPVPVEGEAFVGVGVPDYVNGVVDSPTITTITIDDESFPAINGMRLAPSGADRISLEEARQRMAVELPDKFKTLADLQSPFVESVHRRIRPGNYSGLMRQLVQILLGLGNIFSTTYELRLIEGEEIPPLLMIGEDSDVTSHFGLYEEGAPTHETVIHYDYRAAKTHGLTWGEDGRCYLVQIDFDGVYMMKLPVDPVSETAAGRARYAYLMPELFYAQDGGLSLFEAYGGFPTGEPFPLAEEREKLWKAGDIVKLATKEQASGFYSKIMYSTSMGWAFDPGGGAAMNTCWGTVDGIKQGYLYATHWDVGEWVEPDPPQDVEQLIAQEGLTKDWEIRKANRMTDYQVQRVLSGAEEFEDIIVDQVVPTTSGFYLERSGPLYHPGTAEYRDEEGFTPIEHPSDGITAINCHDICKVPQIKFPEEVLGYSVSFDFLPSTIEEFDGPRCDTPMFVCWRGNEYLQVNYYRQWQEISKQTVEEDSRQECQFEGTWTRTSSGLGSYVKGNFHTTHMDLRRSQSDAGGSVAKTSGRKVGTGDLAAATIYFGRCFFINHYHYFSYTTDTEYAGTNSYNSAVAIPFGDRNIYYTASVDSNFSAWSSRQITKAVNEGAGDTVRFGILYSWLCHWNGFGCPTGKDDDYSYETCVMREMQPADKYVSCFEGSPGFPEYSPCLPDDPGGFLGGECAYNISFNSNFSRGVDLFSSTPVVNEHRYEVRIWGDTDMSGKVVVEGEESGVGLSLYDLELSMWWFIKSPTPCDTHCILSVSTNRYGTPIINYEPQFDANVESFGDLESMFGGVQATYVGYVAP